MFPAIFLDRDGVLIENRSDYVREWSDVEFFVEAIQALTAVSNYKIVVVTNQSAVGRGLIPLDTATQLNHRIVDHVRERGGRIDGVYMCPHAPAEGCTCRKPNPGMLLKAAEELSLDLSRSWMIGDAWSDLLAGHAAGVHAVAILRTGRGSEQLLLPKPENLVDYFVFNDLSDAIREILKPDGMRSNN